MWSHKCSTNCFHFDITMLIQDSIYIPPPLWCMQAWDLLYFCVMTHDQGVLRCKSDPYSQPCLDNMELITTQFCQQWIWCVRAPFPGHIPRPHSQATFPGLIPKPHSQATFPGPMGDRNHFHVTWELSMQCGPSSNKFSIHYRVYKTTKTHPICNFPCRNLCVVRGLQNI